MDLKLIPIQHLPGTFKFRLPFRTLTPVSSSFLPLFHIWLCYMAVSFSLMPRQPDLLVVHTGLPFFWFPFRFVLMLYIRSMHFVRRITLFGHPKLSSISLLLHRDYSFLFSLFTHRTSKNSISSKFAISVLI